VSRYDRGHGRDEIPDSILRRPAEYSGSQETSHARGLGGGSNKKQTGAGAKIFLALCHAAEILGNGLRGSLICVYACIPTFRLPRLSPRASKVGCARSAPEETQLKIMHSLARTQSLQIVIC